MKNTKNKFIVKLNFLMKKKTDYGNHAFSENRENPQWNDPSWMNKNDTLDRTKI